MNKLAFAMPALFAIACAFTQACDAAQMALKLQGDPASFFAVPDHPSLDADLGSVLTVEAWVNPAVDTTDGSVPNEFMILNKEDVYEIAVRNEDPASAGTFQIAVRPLDGSWEWWDSTGTVPVNKWTHVAATWDGNTIRTFVNGRFLQAFDKTAADGGKGVLNDTDDTLKVGRRLHGAAASHSIFNGLIDEVRISKVIRYKETGFDLPTKAFAADADTVALYHFDEASTAATDVQALKTRFDAEGATDDDGAPLVIKGVVKDESSLHNDGALISKAELVAADTPIKDANAP